MNCGIQRASKSRNHRDPASRAPAHHWQSLNAASPLSKLSLDFADVLKLVSWLSVGHLPTNLGTPALLLPSGRVI